MYLLWLKVECAWAILKNVRIAKENTEQDGHS